jgi:tetratricopeptide (TPR) repeat protein
MTGHRATRLIAVALCMLASTVDEACATEHEEFRAAMKLARDGDLQADWNKLADARERFAGFVKDEELSAYAYYYMGYTDWRLSSLAFLALGPSAQGAFLDRAAAALETAVQKRPQFPDAQALLAACLSIRAASDATRRDALAPRIRTAWQAVPPDSTNPRVMLLNAMGLAFAPPPHGNREKGLALWRQAIDRFKTDRPEPPLPDWGDVEAVAWLGGFHLMNDHHKEAIEMLERALEMRPDFWWAGKAALPVARRPLITKPPRP